MKEIHDTPGRTVMPETAERQEIQVPEGLEQRLSALVDRLEAEEDGAIFMKLVSGSGMNVRPADILSLIVEKCGEDSRDPLIRRLEIYGEEGGELLPLSDCGCGKKSGE